MQSGQQPTTNLRDPQALYEFFKTADNEAADAMLAEWRKEELDPDNRQQDTDTQRFFNYIGWTSDTPEVLSELQFREAWKEAGEPRRIYHSDDPYNGIDASQFAMQYAGSGTSTDGTVYRQYLSGGSFGDGTYFASRAVEATHYGRNQFRGFFNSNAHVITRADLDARYESDIKRYPALERVITRMTTGYGNGYRGARSAYAAMLGYNVIDAGFGYFTVLNRSATTISNRMRERPTTDW